MSLLRSRRGAALAVVVALLLAGLTTAAALQHSRADKASAGSGAAPVASASTTTALSCLGAAAVADPACAGRKPGDTVYPAAAAVSGDTALQYDCWTPSYSPLVTCHYGSSAATAPRVALVGDDRAASLLPGLLAALQPTGWSLDTYIGDGCVLAATKDPRCATARVDIDAAITKKSAYAMVVTIANRDENVTAGAYESAFASVTRAGARLAVVRDLPQVSSSALSCALDESFDPQRSTCATSRSTAFASADTLVTAAADTTGASLVDLTADLCYAKTCPAVLGDVYVYRDASANLTTTFSRTLGPFLVARLGRVLAT